MELIDIHTHGGFGVNFNNASAQDINFFAKEIFKRGIVAFCPTLATDSIENLNKALFEIMRAMKNQGANEAKILGVHLEAVFLNPDKKGIHETKYLLEPTIQNFEKLQHREIIKIVTMALELDVDLELTNHLKSKNIKVQLGHTQARELYGADAVTHFFNAMPQLHHREPTATLEALMDDNTYCEIIADLKHVNMETLKMFFKVKPHGKILLVSDSLAIAHSDKEKIEFCGTHIYPDGTDENSNLGGGMMFLDEIINRLDTLKILPKEEGIKMAWDNVLKYLNLDFDLDLDPGI